MILRLENLRGLRGRISIDFETTGLDVYRDRSLGMGVVSPDSGVRGFLPASAASPEQIRSMMYTWEPGSWVMAHNLKFELALLRPERDLLDRLNWYDTQVAEHLLREDGRLDLGACEMRHFRTSSKRSLLAQADEYGGIKNVADWPLELVSEYCINDCHLTDAIARDQAPELRRQNLTRLMAESMRYVLTLYEIERYGMAVDIEAKERMSQKIDRLLSSGERRLADELASHGLKPINYRSAKQLSKLMYQDLGLPWPEMPPELAGSPKAVKYNSTRTDQMFLEQLSYHPVVDLISQYKKVATIRSYMASYEQLGIVEAGQLVLHPSFNPTGTVTGRLSCSSPNLQQVSDKEVGIGLSEDGSGLRLRTIFTARPGRMLVSIDYQQMEVVLFAILSQEPTMIQMVRTGKDMHEQVAALIFGKYDPARRKIVKTLNFGLLYGLGTAGLAEMLGVPIPEAQQLMALYMSRFPMVRPWMTEIEEQLKQVNYVRYWSGRKRRIRDHRLFYRGVNAVVQGGCADVLMRSANRVADYLRSSGSGQIVALVHDEILMEIDRETLQRDITEIKRIMRVEDLLGVPFNVDVEIGSHWSEPLPLESVKG